MLLEELEFISLCTDRKNFLTRQSLLQCYWAHPMSRSDRRFQVYDGSYRVNFKIENSTEVKYLLSDYCDIDTNTKVDLLYRTNLTILKNVVKTSKSYISDKLGLIETILLDKREKSRSDCLFRLYLLKLYLELEYDENILKELAQSNARLISRMSKTNVLLKKLLDSGIVYAVC